MPRWLRVLIGQNPGRTGHRVGHRLPLALAFGARGRIDQPELEQRLCRITARAIAGNVKSADWKAGSGSRML